MSALRAAFENIDAKRKHCEEEWNTFPWVSLREPEVDREAVLKEAVKVLGSRQPDLVIAHGSKGYLQRWYVEYTKERRWYIHRFVGSDPSDLHDHPSHSVSWCLHGKMKEYYHGGGGDRDVVEVRPGYCIYRSPDLRHRIVIPWRLFGRSAITLFAFGPRIKEWGFYPNGVYTPWREYKAEAIVKTLAYSNGA